MFGFLPLVLYLSASLQRHIVDDDGDQKGKTKTINNELSTFDVTFDAERYIFFKENGDINGGKLYIQMSTCSSKMNNNKNEKPSRKSMTTHVRREHIHIHKN